MLRSLYSGISGMKNFQLKLDVIGNNIANVGTYGYKKSRITFKELVNQQISGASAASGGLGGVNPKQVGLGSNVGTIDTIHTSGATQTTARTLDLAITGDGFFPVATIRDFSRVNIDSGGKIGNNIISGNINNAADLAYTRAGNFYLDDRGYLVTGDGMYVVGETGEKSIPTDDGIKKANDALTAIASFNSPYENIFESLKEIYKKANDVKGAFEAYNESVKIWTDGGSPAKGPLYDAMNSAHQALQTMYAEFHSNVTNAQTGFDTIATDFANSLAVLNNSIDTFNGTQPVTDIMTKITSAVSTISGSYPDASTIKAGTPASSTQLDAMNQLLNNLESYSVDLNNVAQTVIQYEEAAESLKEPSWSSSLSGEAGLIQIPLSAKSFSIGPDGTVTFVNKTGELNVAGQLRLANFPNAGGLEKIGGNLFKESSNSGSIDRNGNGIQLDELYAPGTEGTGSITSGALEMSNVDLSEEFTEMIVAQRGFQSNTKIITTSDEILQELMSLKR
ncbi:flagellar hook-basal body complex protein [Bacillus sp. FJAT-47783]|uniref:flagellar hook-basal body complex protein n=1 Tax=Bacillus sp. FJAT-47783 TaxID=2922712 RepID=UPI001FAD127D|nr:flagellar hook-basal body complex protein [Bacillus sp. FJAT-47783]